MTGRPPQRPLERNERECRTADGKPKVAYPYRDVAREAAREMNRRYRPTPRVAAYKCSKCQQFHVGRQPSEPA